ncbi:MAG: alpha-L-fucosidase [Williamsia sp.]|nr:alpha-L-fucosidase [Williamsia sp.]
MVAFFFCLLLSAQWSVAQEGVHPQSSTYEWPDDSLVRRKLDQWQDLKFGMIIHWGLYAVPGIIESWSICSENWIERDSTIAYDDYKKWYWGLKKDFNPIRFDPEQWAAACKGAGMKYLVFTTKHHDGFCMFDTRQTDFSIAKGPFAGNPKADVARWVFDAFRKQGFMIGAYFSKPDWHSEYYWWPKYATPDRNYNYDIRKYTWRWQQFKQYTYNQLSELMHNYGQVDILWLDGGWVRPGNSVTAEVLSWGAPIPPAGQDIEMPRIARMAREAQPGLLMVDRTVHGPYENYQTPEQHVPAGQLDHPWESCMTLANNWGFVPNDRYKSTRKVIHTLIEIVAKGGSLLLGVGPKPDGTLPTEAVERLAEIGKWMNQNGAAIYGTRPVKDYKQDSLFFTQHKTNGHRYAILCIPEKGFVPATIHWKNNFPKAGSRMTLLQTGKTVKWSRKEDNIEVELPAGLLNSERPPALAFEFVATEQP